ncbi:MAG: hypothetical protein WAN43_08980 [Rhodomicrobium sp.]
MSEAKIATKTETPVTAAAGEATLRDEFAKAALIGLLSTYRSDGGWPKSGWGTIARGAYLIANAMIEARVETDHK